jgi:replicative DNA helicase
MADTGAQPPMDLEAERAVLGAILVDEANYWSVSEVLRSDHFFLPMHQRIYATIREVMQEGKSLSFSILVSRLGPEIDGQTTSHYLSSQHRRAEDQGLRAVDFNEAIIEAWARRRLLDLGKLALTSANDKRKHALDILSEIQVQLADVQMGAEAEPLKSIGEAATRAMKKARLAQDSGIAPGFDTGLPSMDEVIGRIMPTDLGAILASQGDGKTLIAMQIATRVAEVYGGALVFSMEMYDEDLARRSIASLADVSAGEIEEGNFDLYAMERIKEAHSHLIGQKLWIDDRPKLYLDQMRDRVIKAKKSKGIVVAIYDHARKIKVRGQKFNDKFDRMEYITGFLKELAKETGVAQILLCQRSRKAQRRDDPAPQIGDFPEGSSLEQDADWILGGLRRDVWLNQNKPLDWESKDGRKWQDDYADAKGKIELYGLKRRRGQVGEMRKLLFNGRNSRLEEIG